MKGIYLERDIYEPGEYTMKDVAALQQLGIKCEIIWEGIPSHPGKLKILEDTSEELHELCDDEDALAMVKHKRRDSP